MVPDLTFRSLLNPADRELLKAATLPEATALAALDRWRALVPLDDIESSVRWAMPRLLELASRHRIDDPDIGRIRGINRYIWASNVIRLNVLFKAIEALERAGVPALLLKGAAVLARDASAATARAAGDYDILIAPEAITSAREALAAAGFVPKQMQWRDVEDSIVDCPTPSTPLEIAGASGDIDLHWRPLPHIHDRALTARLFRGAERTTLHGRDVSIPGLAHHLFLAIARCEPWDSNECLARLLEGHSLISKFGDALDWRELDLLVQRYRLQAIAAAYFGGLREDCGLRLPAAAPPPSSAPDPRGSKEWALRSIPPARRRPIELRALAQIDADAHRAPADATVPGLMEAALRQFSPRPPLGLLWKLACDRVQAVSGGERRFLEGFSYPERAGRWTNGHWALLAMPLSDAQRRGEPVRFNVHAFLGGRKTTTIHIYAGRERLRWSPHETDSSAELVVRCRAVNRLGGDALVLFWIPEAIAPHDLGVSDDRRRLGLFVCRD